MMYETAAAPSPVVPTVPSQLPRKKRLGMSAMTSKLSTAIPTRHGSLHRQQRRPSEASIKSAKTLNVLHLLRGSQSPDASSQTLAPVEGGEGDDGAAAAAAASEAGVREKGGGGALEVLKAGHRRLLQFAQRNSSTASGQETISQKTDQIERSDDLTRPDSPSQGSLGKTVETQSNIDIDVGDRLAPLDFGDFDDFIAMLSPSPYETSSSSQHSVDATTPPSSADQDSADGQTQPIMRREPSNGTIVIGMRKADMDEKANASPASKITDHNFHPQRGLLDGKSAQRLDTLLRAEKGLHGKERNDEPGYDKGATQRSRDFTAGSATSFQSYPQSITSYPRSFVGSNSLAPQRVSSKNALRSLNSDLRTPKADNISPTPSSSSSVTSESIGVGVRPRLSSDTQASGVTIPFSTVSSSSERSAGSRENRSEEILYKDSLRDRKQPRLMSTPLGTIPAFPLPPMTPLPPLPKFPVADQNRKEKASKLSPQVNSRYIHAQRIFGADQQDTHPAPNSSRAQTPETASVSSSQPRRKENSPNGLGAPVRATRQKVPYDSSAEINRKNPRQGCTLRLKDMTNNNEDRDNSKEYHVKEEKPSTPAEWLVFPPLSSPKTNVVPPFRPRDIRLGADAASQNCPPRHTGAHTFRTDSVRSEGICRETATNVSNRFKSPALPSTDVEHLSPDSWSYCSYGSSDQSSMKAQEQRIPRSTSPSDAFSMSKYGTPPNNSSSLSLRSGNSSQHQEKIRFQRQHTILSNGSSRSQQSLKLRSLESRITQLENQNKILRAALFATFDIGSKLENTSRLRGFPEPESPSSPKLKPSPSLPLMGNCSIGSGDDPVMRVVRNRNTQRQKQSLKNRGQSSGDSVRDSSDFTSSSASIREMEDIMVNLDIDWMAEGLS